MVIGSRDGTANVGAPVVGDCVDPPFVGTPDVEPSLGPVVVGKPVDDNWIGISVIVPPVVGSPVLES